MKTPITHLSDLSACREAVDWVKSTKCRSLESAWLKCERADWLLWYVGKKAGPCAELVLPIFEKEYPKDDRPRKAIEAARAFTSGRMKKSSEPQNATGRKSSSANTNPSRR